MPINKSINIGDKVFCHAPTVLKQGHVIAIDDQDWITMQLSNGDRIKQPDYYFEVVN